MVKISKLKLVPELAEKGRWFVYTPGVELLIASAKGQAFQRGHTELLRDKSRHIISTESRQAVHEECRLEAASRFLLLGWRGIEDDADVAVPYTSRQALEWMRDPGYADMRDFVWICASEAANFREAALDDSAKN